MKTFSLDQIAKTGALNADSIMKQHKFMKTAKFKEIKSANQNSKKSEIARELKISSSALQRYRRKLNMLSPYRLPPSSKTQTKKQKTSKQTKHDLKMTSNGFKITSNDLKNENDKTVSKK